MFCACISTGPSDALVWLFPRSFESYYGEVLLMKINDLILTLPGNLLRASNHKAYITCKSEDFTIVGFVNSPSPTYQCLPSSQSDTATVRTSRLLIIIHEPYLSYSMIYKFIECTLTVRCGDHASRLKCKVCVCLHVG